MSAVSFLGNFLSAFTREGPAETHETWSAQRTGWLVSLSLSIFEGIEDVSAHWSAHTLPDEAYPIEDASNIRSLYARWLAQATRILEHADAVATGDIVVQELQDLRRAILIARGILSVSLERAAAEHERQRREGHSKSIPATEVRSALQRRMETAGH